MNPYDETRAPLADLNAGLKHTRVLFKDLTDDCKTARKPFALYSTGTWSQIARYGSLETATKAAHELEALIAENRAKRATRAA
jgi:hypothetical protein